MWASKDGTRVRQSVYLSRVLHMDVRERARRERRSISTIVEMALMELPPLPPAR